MGLRITFSLAKKPTNFQERLLAGHLLYVLYFFILNLIILIALSNTAAAFFNDILNSIGFSISSLQLFSVNDLPKSLGLVVFS